MSAGAIKTPDNHKINAKKKLRVFLCPETIFPPPETIFPPMRYDERSRKVASFKP
jgi:hypothetical protein